MPNNAYAAIDEVLVFTEKLIAFCVIAGTGVQAILALSDFKAQDPDAVGAHAAIDEFRGEFKWWRAPRRWWAQRKVLKHLKADSPAEWRSWRSVELRLLSWSLLLTAALISLFA